VTSRYSGLSDELCWCLIAQADAVAFARPPYDAPMIEPATRIKTLLAFAAVSIIWGSTYLAIRVSLEGFPPFFVSGMRFVIAGATLYVALRLRGEAPPTAKQWGSAFVTGALFFVVGNAFVNVAEETVSSGLVSVLVATMPLWATVFLRALGERVSPREWAGIGLGLVGVVVLNLGGELRAGGHGALYALCAPVGWALGSVASKRLPLPRGAMATAAQMIAGGSVVLFVSRAMGEPVVFAAPLRAWIAVGYLAVFGSIVGFTAYTYLLHHTRPAVATSYAYVNPVIALALGVVFAHEHIDLASAVGASIVLAAVLLITRSKTRPGAVARLPYRERLDEPRSTRGDHTEGGDDRRTTEPGICAPRPA